MAKGTTREERLSSLLEARVMENREFHETVRYEAAAVEREACARLVDGLAASAREPGRGLLELAAIGIRKRKEKL